ncbi:MAG: transporter ATP-binding protein, partial [Paenibacillaceae bacterium]|nr:transporter ATP-binding protein [Paenibacillaceae bacterium]
MILVQGHQLGKRYTDDWVLKGVNCEIQAKDRIGLVGRNGSGKSTLLNLLTGKETPDEGAVHVQKGLRVGHMEQVFDRYLELGVNEVI